MSSLWYSATLESDVVITARSATVGAHETLDYLPGATFLGALAARLYRHLSAEEAFIVFHSGEVIFCDARPLVTERQAPAIPMPLSLHSPKSKQTDIYNFAHGQYRRQAGLQYKQLRQGYIHAEAQGLMRIQANAISTRAKVGFAKSPLSRREKGEDNQLYTYSAIAAGARFIFELRAMTPRAEALVSRIAEELGQRNRVRIGRSKRSEYGAVKVQSIVAPLSYQRKEQETYMSFFALSDCALRDPQTGAPTLVPSSEAFGLPQGSEVDWSLTHIRRRAYSPFNGKRARVDLERQVLSRGSVVTFKRPAGVSINAKTLDLHLAWGIGDYTESGLGQWLLNPSALDSPQLEFTTSVPSTHQSSPLELPFMTWASRAVEYERYKADAGEMAIRWAQRMKPYCGGRKGLSRAQLGTLRAAGERLEKQALFTALFTEEGEFTVCATRGVRAQKWIHNERGGVHAAETLRRLFEEAQSEQHIWSLALQATASRLVKSLNRQGTDEREEA